MTERDQEPRSFETDDAEGERAIETLRRGVARARERVRQLRRNLDREHSSPARARDQTAKL